MRTIGSFVAWYLGGMLAVLLVLYSCDPAISAERCRTVTLEQRLAFIDVYLGGRGTDYRTHIETDGEIKRLYLIASHLDGYVAAVIFFSRDCQLVLPARPLDPERTARDIFGEPLTEMFPSGLSIRPPRARERA